MTAEVIWKRYAATWSLGDEQRKGELAACLANDATYCDPNGLIEGPDELSGYMRQFQNGAPEARFEIGSVLHHHGRSIANWTLRGPGGGALQTGTSFATLAADGRLQDISGFFYSAKEPTQP
ncbi:MAG: hypothetical protein JWL86_5254 [Rhizobium sp.]|nr:hypothetical protein [Rhizobium sp.]